MSDTTDSSNGADQPPDQPLVPLPVSNAPVWAAAPARRQQRMPVVLKLTLLVGLTFAVLVAVFVAANGLFFRNVMSHGSEKQLRALATTRRDLLRAQIALLRQRVELNTDRGELRGLFFELSKGELSPQNREGSQDTLRRIANGKPITAAALVDMKGQIVLSTLPQEVGQSVAATAEFRAGLTQTHLGFPRQVSDHFEATLTSPVRSRTEPPQVYGVLLVRVDVSDLANTVREKNGLGETGDALLGARDGDRVRFLFPSRNTPQTTAAPLSSLPPLKAAIEGATTFLKTNDYRGIPVLAAGEPLDEEGWGFVVKMDRKEADKPIFIVTLLEAAAGLIVAALGLVAAYILARNFTRPLVQLEQAALRVAAGDYTTAVPVRSDDDFGTLSSSFNAMTTAIQMRNDERERAEEAMREADRRKDEFLAMLGHELRNPLSAISNAVRLWNAAPEDQSSTELARDVIERQSAHLSRLVDDLLDVGRITEGKIELRKQAVDVVDAISHSVEAARPFIDDRRHELEISLADEAKLFVEADPTRFEQIVTNLLTNAIKYTRRPGRISIETRKDGNDVVISISDNGIGMSARMLPHVFDLFAQGDRSLDRTTGGLGIGLHLCQKLVGLHGGSISAVSDGVGRGSTFTVRLPAIPAPEFVPTPLPLARPEIDGRQRRILLVDDNQDTVRSLARLLTMRGHQVATAFDGVAALKLAHEFHPDFLLLDLGLPGLDGYELARRLRAEGFAQTPIVAISGYAQASDRARSREAGFNYHFAKPVDFDALADLIIEDPIAVE